MGNVGTVAGGVDVDFGTVGVCVMVVVVTVTVTVLARSHSSP